jgi:hypothetical protein
VTVLPMQWQVLAPFQGFNHPLIASQVSGTARRLQARVATVLLSLGAASGT